MQLISNKKASNYPTSTVENNNNNNMVHISLIVALEGISKALLTDLKKVNASSKNMCDKTAIILKF